MTNYEQQVIDRERQAQAPIDAPGHDRAGSRLAGAMRPGCLTALDERAARATLRTQIARLERERRAREQLAQMQLHPGRYKFARLPVRDLGQGVCGVWEVRPRLGLIGMLAGWWQLKLSSGCPLARGSRSKRDPGSQR